MAPAPVPLVASLAVGIVGAVVGGWSWSSVVALALFLVLGAVVLSTVRWRPDPRCLDPRRTVGEEARGA